MKKLLLVGGSHSEIPLIQAARAMGYYIITTGNNEDGLGHKLADNYIKGDFSDKEFIYKIAKDENVDAIVSGCNDFAYLSTAYVCDRLGLAGHDKYEIAQTVHLKSKFREMVRGLGIKAPKAVICRLESDCLEAIRAIEFPLIVKPVDLTGGKGVKICHSIGETIEAFFEAMKVTREDYVILEEFIQGKNHGMTTLLKHGRVVFWMSDDEQYGVNKYLVRGASSPSKLTGFAESILINDIEKIAAHLKLVDGLFHVQFIIDHTGYPIMIDPCRRAPGDLYILLAKYVTGVDYPLEIVKAESGLEVNDAYFVQHNYIARECIMGEIAGLIKDIHIDEELQKLVVYSCLWNKDGDYIDDPMKYKAGILIMRFDSYFEMQEVLKNFERLVWIEVQQKT